MKASNPIHAVLLSTVLTFISVSAHAERGGSGTGGGNVCHTQGRLTVLDLVGIESPTSATGTQISFNPSFADLGAQPINLVTGALQQQLNLVLNQAENLNPNLIEQIKTAIGSLTMYAIPSSFNHAINAHFHFSNPMICNEENTRAVIGFNQGMIFVSVPSWNQLDLWNQTGLIVHEAARVLQNVYLVPLTDLELQNLTAAIMSANEEKLNAAAENIYQKMDPSLRASKQDLQKLMKEFYSRKLIDAKTLSLFQDINMQKMMGQIQQTYIPNLTALIQFQETTNKVFQIYMNIRTNLIVSTNTFSLTLWSRIMSVYVNKSGQGEKNLLVSRQEIKTSIQSLLEPLR